MTTRHRVLTPEDFPESARTAPGLTTYLDELAEVGWEFVGNVGRLAVFRRRTDPVPVAAPAPRRTVNLVDDDE